MKIVYCLRRDAFSKKGGDSGKVVKYKKEFESLNDSVAVVLHPSELNNLGYKPDLIHMFNVQAPYENYKYLRWAEKNNIPVVFSPIHHQKKYMSKYFDNSILGAVLGFDLYQYLVALAKEVVVYRAIDNFISYFISPGMINKKILAKAKAILPMSYSEMSHLEIDLGVTIPREKVKIIPNGLTFLGRAVASSSRDIDVVVVGRIEPRKNQLKIAKSLKSSGYKVVFIGDKNLNHPSYFRNFIEVVNSVEGFEYIGGIEQAQLIEYYQRARISLSNSWFEVVSQVDLEAATVGCKPVVSIASAIFDYFSEDLITLEPSCCDDDIRRVVDEALLDSYAPKINDGYLLDWHQVVVKLRSIYSLL